MVDSNIARPSQTTAGTTRGTATSAIPTRARYTKDNFSYNVGAGVRWTWSGLLPAGLRGCSARFDNGTIEHRRRRVDIASCSDRGNAGTAAGPSRPHFRSSRSSVVWSARPAARSRVRRLGTPREGTCMKKTRCACFLAFCALRSAGSRRRRRRSSRDSRLPRGQGAGAAGDSLRAPGTSTVCARRSSPRDGPDPTRCRPSGRCIGSTAWRRPSSGPGHRDGHGFADNYGS